MTKSELIEKSKEVFKLNPKAESLIATEDGQFFLPEAKGLALDYCRKKGVEKHIINKDEITDADPKAKADADVDAKAKVKETTSKNKPKVKSK